MAAGTSASGSAGTAEGAGAGVAAPTAAAGGCEEASSGGAPSAGGPSMTSDSESAGPAGGGCYQRGLPLGRITHNWVSDSEQRVMLISTYHSQSHVIE